MTKEKRLRSASTTAKDRKVDQQQSLTTQSATAGKHGSKVAPSQPSARSRTKSAHQVAELLSGVAAKEFTLKTTIVTGGLANLGCYLHEVQTITPRTNTRRFIEKHTRSQRETRFAPSFQAIKLPEGIPVGPEIYRIAPISNHHVIFMEFIQGEDLARTFKSDRREIGIKELSRTLLTISKYKGELLETNFSDQVYLPLLSLAKNPHVSEAMKRELLALHVVMPHEIKQVVARLPRVACHNDVFFANMFLVSGSIGQAVRLIDWGSCGRNMIGAELHHFVSASQKVAAMVPISDRLIEEYAEGLLAGGASTSQQQVRLGATCIAWQRALARLRNIPNLETAENEARTRHLVESGTLLRELIAQYRHP